MIRPRIVHTDDAKVCAYCDHLHDLPTCPRCGCERVKPYQRASTTLVDIVTGAIDRGRSARQAEGDAS